MSEKEVAAYLDLNPRTLQRYRKSGRLAFRQVPGKTRPTIEYERADVEALKRELERQRTRAAKPVSPPLPQTRRVTFGLPLEGYRELSAEAEKYGLRVGEYARRLVREGLESQFASEAAELRGELKRLSKEIEGVRAETKQNRAALQAKARSESAAEESATAAREANERGIAELRITVEAMEQRVNQVGEEVEQDVEQDVEQARQEFQEKFEEFALGLEAILEFTGLSAVESKQWVNENLR